MPPSPKNPINTNPNRGDWSVANLSFLAVLTAFAFVIMGYHAGLEDDAFYLAAIKRNLNPALFPHDADFFRVQFQATIFDKLIAASIRLTHLPAAWVVMFWQLAAIFFILHGCWRIARRCFVEPAAQWAAVSLIAALLTLPVSGTAINLADQYLHPRALATALILAAVVAVLERRVWLAVLLLIMGFSIHAIMAAFGISFCAFLVWHRRPMQLRASSAAAAFLFPLGWVFEPASDAWRKAASTRGFYYISHWAWYEWLGVLAPLALLFLFQRAVRRRRLSMAGGPALVPLVSSLLYYGVFQTVVGVAIMLPASLERLRPLEPMRYLHLLYLLFFLLAGGLLGQYVLGRYSYRWALLFLPLSAGMWYAQLQMCPASAHMEWPGATPQNSWLQAFDWIRKNTPLDALFALDPHYMQIPGEDYHGFRALAERSVLADYDKDGGMAARVPRLAPRWLREVTAESGWRDFGAEDFGRLKNEFGVNWIILSREDKLFSQTQSESMTCPYENQQVRLCRLY